MQNMWKDALLIAAPIATAVATVVLATLTFFSIKRLGRQDERQQVEHIVNRVVSHFISVLDSQISFLESGKYTFYRRQSIISSPKWGVVELGNSVFIENNKVFCEDFQEREENVWKAVESYDDESRKLQNALRILHGTIYSNETLYTEVQRKYGHDDMSAGMLELPIAGKNVLECLRKLEEYRIVVEHHNKLKDISISLKKDLEKIRRKWRKKYKIP